MFVALEGIDIPPDLGLAFAHAVTASCLAMQGSGDLSLLFRGVVLGTPEADIVFNLLMHKLTRALNPELGMLGFGTSLSAVPGPT